MAVQGERRRGRGRIKAANSVRTTGATDMTDMLTFYDPAEDLTSDSAIAIFMAEAFVSEDAGDIAHALGVVAWAKSMAQIARVIPGGLWLEN